MAKDPLKSSMRRAAYAIRRLAQVDPEAAKEYAEKFPEIMQATPESNLKDSSWVMHGIESVFGAPERAVAGAAYGAIHPTKGVWESAKESVTMDKPVYWGDVYTQEEKNKAAEQGLSWEEYKKRHPARIRHGVPFAREGSEFDSPTQALGRGLQDTYSSVTGDPMNLWGTGALTAGAHTSSIPRLAGSAISKVASKSPRAAKAVEEIAEAGGKAASQMRSRFSHLDEMENFRRGTDKTLAKSGAEAESGSALGQRQRARENVYEDVSMSHDRMKSQFDSNSAEVLIRKTMKDLTDEDRLIFQDVVENPELVGELSEDGQNAVYTMRALFDSVGDDAERLGLVDGMRKNFFPHVEKSESFLQKVGRFLGGEDARPYSKRMEGRLDKRDGGFYGVGAGREQGHFGPREAVEKLNEIEAARARTEMAKGADEVTIEEIKSMPTSEVLEQAGKEPIPNTREGKRQVVFEDGKTLADELEVDPEKAAIKYAREAIPKIKKMRHVDDVIDSHAKNGMFIDDETLGAVVQQNMKMDGINPEMASESVFKRYKDNLLRDAGDYQELVVNGRSMGYLPAESVSYLKSIGDRDELHWLLKGVRTFNRMWAPVVLLTPGFHLRNLTSNNFLLLEQFGPEAFRFSTQKGAFKIATGATEGAYFRHAGIRDALKKLGEDVPLGNHPMDISLEELAQDMKNFGLLGQELTGQYGGARPSSKWNIFQKSKNAGSMIEDHAKAAAFITALNEIPAEQFEKMALGVRGGKFTGSVLPKEALQRAMKRTNDTLFNYANLSNDEIRVLKSLFPFYTWQRKNTSLQLKLLAKRPNLFRHWIRSQMAMPQAEDRPEYVTRKGGYSIQSPGSERAALTLDVPMAAIGQIGSAHDLISGLSPITRVPIEIADGTGYRGRPLPKNADGSIRWREYLQSKVGGPIYQINNIVNMITDNGRADQLEQKRRWARLASAMFGIKVDYSDVNTTRAREYGNLASAASSRL